MADLKIPPQTAVTPKYLTWLSLVVVIKREGGAGKMGRYKWVKSMQLHSWGSGPFVSDKEENNS